MIPDVGSSGSPFLGPLVEVMPVFESWAARGGPSVLTETLLAWAVLGTLAAAGVALALRLTRALNASTRVWIWSATLILVAAIPLTPHQLVRDNAEALGARLERAAAGADPRISESSQAPPSSTGGVPAASGPLQGADLRSTAGDGDPAPGLAALASLAARWTARVPTWLGLVYAGVWLILAVWRTLRLVGAWVEVRLLASGAVPAATADRRMLSRLAAEAKVDPVPPLRRLRRLEGPACLGWTSPWIALPADWPGGLGCDARRHALLHELAHAVRRDSLVALVQRVLEVLLAGHPAAWWISRQIDLEREIACDDWAIAHSGDSPVGYGRSLLEHVDVVPLPRPIPAAGYLHHRTRLQRRIRTMIDANRDHRIAVRRLPLTLATASLGIALLGSAAAWPRQGAVATATTVHAATVAMPVANAPGSERHPRLRADDAPLYATIRRGDIDLTRALLDAGEPVNQVWPGDGSPLIEAVRSGSSELLRLLLDRGAEVDLGVGGDGTAMIAAARRGDVEMVELLLAYGADVDHAGRGGDGNPLIAASLAGDVEMARLLVARGARVDIHVPDDDTPLINAAQQGHVEMVRYLLEIGADPDLTGDFDRRLETVRTPLNQALARGHDEVAELLRRAGARR
ncbi:MAG: hypothetical protein DWQ36_07815 [Acidobacteria bacterium]|nr:MAG: hypothetical protein DWQ30_04010 [Acidobacteriota bacterium]REK08873.1 MAG: hypothetical protein DWQ36_07815 [Acidobacteriota bacterium]